MKNQFLLDTSFLVSFVDDTDVLHQKAMRIMSQWDEDKDEIFLSDVALNESLSVLARKCENRRQTDQFPQMARKFFDAVQEMPILCLYQHFNPFFQPTVHLMKEYLGVLNFHDCLIAIFLKTVPEVQLVTFDTDFRQIPWLKILDERPIC